MSLTEKSLPHDDPHYYLPQPEVQISLSIPPKAKREKGFGRPRNNLGPAVSNVYLPIERLMVSRGGG